MGQHIALMVSEKGNKVRKWRALMRVKRHAGHGGLSLEPGCFSGPGAAHQHGSAGAYGPPLIPPTHSSLLPLPLPLCSLENGCSALGKLDGNAACCILGLNMRKASLQS